MDSGMFEGLWHVAVVGFIAILLLIGLGAYSVVDYYFIDDYITTEQRLEPILTITKTDKRIDTIYTYKLP